LTLAVTVPANTTAEIAIPADSADAVRENGNPAQTATGVKSADFSNGTLTLLVGSGHYDFTVSRRN